jgi:hypothetical protein
VLERARYSVGKFRAVFTSMAGCLRKSPATYPLAMQRVLSSHPSTRPPFTPATLTADPAETDHLAVGASGGRGARLLDSEYGTQRTTF